MAPRDGDRHLHRAQPLLERLDEELRAVELLLAQHEPREHLGADRPVAVGAVGDLGAGERRDEPVEEGDPELARERVGLRAAEHARAVGHVVGAVEHRHEQALHLLGQVLAVGVHRDDRARTRLDEQPEPGAQRGAAAAVYDVTGDRGALGQRHPGRGVARPVVDHQHGGRDAGDLGGDPAQHQRQVVGLVEGGDDDPHVVAEALRDRLRGRVQLDAVEGRRAVAAGPAVSAHHDEDTGRRANWPPGFLSSSECES